MPDRDLDDLLGGLVAQIEALASRVDGLERLELPRDLSINSLRVGEGLDAPPAGGVTAKTFGYNSTSLGDDAALSFTPALPTGIILIGFVGGNTDVWGIATFRTTPSSVCVKMVGGSNFAVTTGALAGTTGTDTFLTVSAHTDGDLYIENRRGASQSFHIIVLGAL